MVIGISGRIGSGKDVVASMIQNHYYKFSKYYEPFEVWDSPAWQQLLKKDSRIEIKKFAYKLKLVASILTGIPVEKFENHDFKNSIMGGEWAKVEHTMLNDIEPFKDVPIRVLPTVRSFLQKLGTDALREHFHPDVWLNALWSDYEDKDRWVITDVRFDNEANSIKERGGVVIRLTRNEDEKPIHKSETELDNYYFDYVIDNKNTTLEETFEMVNDFLEHNNLFK